MSSGADPHVPSPLEGVSGAPVSPLRAVQGEPHLRVLIDHDVLAVRRAERAIWFYRRVFGAGEPEWTATPVQTTTWQVYLEMLPFYSSAGLFPRGAPRFLDVPLPVVQPPFRGDPGRYADLEVSGQGLDVRLVHPP